MVTLKKIIEQLDKFAKQITKLTEGQGDFYPMGDIRMRASWIQSLLKELGTEGELIEKEIEGDEERMRKIEHLLGF